MGTKTLNPDFDAYVHESNADTRFGDTDSLLLKTGLDVAAGTEFRSFLHFDLSVLEAGAVLDTVTLRLFVSGGASASGGIAVHRVSQDFVENIITWNNRPETTNPIISASGTVVLSAYKEIDITTIVQGWVDGNYENKGLLVLSVSANNIDQIYTSSEGALGQQPELVIDFHSGPTEEERKVTDLIQKLPDFWREASVMESIYRAMSPELTLLNSFLRTQSSQPTDERDDYLNNDMGWGFERLINQLFIISTNHFFDKFRDIYQVQTDFPVYEDLRNRLLLLSRTDTINPPQSMIDDLAFVGLVTDFVENFALYTIALSIRVDKSEYLDVAQRRIEQTIPAHIGGTFTYFNCATNDPIPCELGDPDAILLRAITI